MHLSNFLIKICKICKLST